MTTEISGFSDCKSLPNPLRAADRRHTDSTKRKGRVNHKHEFRKGGTMFFVLWKRKKNICEGEKKFAKGNDGVG